MTTTEGSNPYVDADLAAYYSSLGFDGTYWLVERDLPAVLDTYVSGRRALDFACGGGRSTRLLAGLGYDVLGVDMSEQMLGHARASDPGGDYRHVADGDLAICRASISSSAPIHSATRRPAPTCGGSSQACGRRSRPTAAPS